MGIFNSSCMVGCVVPASPGDHPLGSSGALSYGGITAQTALAGTTGVDAKLVTGNRWQQVNGSMIENFANDVTTKISQDESHTVLNNSTKAVQGNHKETITGQRTDLVVGPHNHTNVGVRNNTYVNPKSEVHSGEKGSEEPGSWFKTIGVEGRFYGVTLDIIALKTELVLAMELCMAKTSYELGIMKAAGWMYSAEGQLCNTKEKMMESKVEGLQSKIEALQTKVAAIEPNVVPLKANAGIRVGVDSPWGG